MIVGQSIFDSVLDGMKTGDAEEPAARAASWTGIRGLNASFVGTDSQSSVSLTSNHLNDAYSAYAADEFAPASTPEIDTAIFSRLSPVEIAEDMNLASANTAAELQQKRRDFAQVNHPDRTPAEWREQATTRMKIANLLIDEALKQAILKQR